MTPRTRLWTCALVSLSACRAAPEDREPRRLAEMGAEDAELRQRVAAQTERLLRENTNVFGAVTEMPTIEAKVLSLDAEPRRVVLDKGKRDGVVPGFVFDLYRGAQYKGRVKVLDVLDASCSGSILSETRPMEVGDSATTNL